MKNNLSLHMVDAKSGRVLLHRDYPEEHRVRTTIWVSAQVKYLLPEYLDQIVADMVAAARVAAPHPRERRRSERRAPSLNAQFVHALLWLAATGGWLVGSTGCAARADLAPSYYHAQLYACCNLFVELTRRGDFVLSDLNATPGLSMIPVGTPVRLVEARGRTIEFTAGGDPMVLLHRVGRGREPLEDLVERTFVRTDPRARIAMLPATVRSAVEAGRVVRGMTREQVVWAIGYPPRHRTPSMDAAEWLYWRNRSKYRVIFDAQGLVAEVVGAAHSSVGEGGADR